MKFIVYISPLPEPLIRTYIGHKEDFKLYKLWIKDIIDVFDSVHNYMYSNNITRNYQYNFSDATHFYPKVGESILVDIFDKDHDLQNNLCLLINQNNYLEYMDFIEKQFIDLNNSQKNNLDIISKSHL